MARLLLFLSRKAPVVSLLLASSACVIPVVPEFENPPATKNIRPQILAAMPIVGTRASTSRFSVTVTDPNPTDPLELLWLADYPPVGPSMRKLARDVIQPNADGTPLQEPRSIVVDCAIDNLEKGVPTHSIHLLVADREFKTNTDDLAELVNGDRAAEANWTWVNLCP